jgi:cytochrome c1
VSIVEQESHRWSFFILSVIVAGTIAWVAYDEVITRRPWKNYQDEFARLSAAAAEEELAAAKAKVDAAKIEALHKEMADLEAGLKDPARSAAYAAAKDKVRKVADDLKGGEQNLAFRKGESDELFYKYTIAITAPGHTPAATPAPRGLGASCAADADCDAPGLCLPPELVPPALNGYCAIREELLLRKKTAEVIAIKAKVDALEAAKKAALAEVATFDGRLEDIKKELEEYEKPIADAERKLEKAKSSSSEIIQFNLTHLGRVDRCVSCHVGIDKAGFENTEKYVNPYRTHPRRDVLLAKHPPETFGCTVCHDGEGPQTKGVGALGAKYDHAYDDHYWETPLLDLYPARNLEKLPDVPGAAAAAAGTAVPGSAAPATAAAEAGAAAGHGEAGGHAGMLAVLPELRASKKFVEASCLKCHNSEVGIWYEMTCAADTDCPSNYACTEVKPVAKPGEPEPPPPTPDKPYKKSCERKDLEGFRLVDWAPTLTRGAEIVAEVGCFGCHPIPRFADRAKIGPNLNRLGMKTKAGWLVEWIKYPKAFRPRTKMPNFFPEVRDHDKIPLIYDAANPAAALATYTARRDDEAKAMTAFLMSVTMADRGPIPAALPVDGDATRGEKLFHARGCEGCHTIDAASKVDPTKNRFSHYSHAPDLSNVGAKLSPEWAYAWIKDPKSLWPSTRMPSLRLPDQEAADIVAFLMTKTGDKAYDAPPAGLEDKDLIARGQALVKKYGCPGCHDIPTLESEGKIGADLSEFGLKDHNLLDFGNAVEDHHLHNWYVWLKLKLEHPRAFGTERIETRMPEFELHSDELEAVMVFLKGNRGKENTGGLARVRTPAEKAVDDGRRIMIDRNCFGCHNIDQWSGALMAKFVGPDATKGPPSLWREGEKVQGPWVFKFLKEPIPLRPWLDVRMPTFGFSDKDSTALAGYFAGMSKVSFPFEAQVHDPLGGERLADAKTLFAFKQCKQCHPAAGAASAGDVDPSALAPDLTLAKERLRAEFLATWLTDPLSFAAPASTRMPTLFYVVDSSADDAPVLKGKYKEQIELLRDYLFVFGTPADAAATAATASPAPAPVPDAPPGAPTPTAIH